MESELESILRQFIALPCWAVVAGEGTGSMVSLAFGDKTRRDKPLENIHLAEDYRLYSSGYSIFIQMGSWLLEKGEFEICLLYTSDAADD